jgi:hypothetical protein
VGGVAYSLPPSRFWAGLLGHHNLISKPHLHALGAEAPSSFVMLKAERPNPGLSGHLYMRGCFLEA